MATDDSIESLKGTWDYSSGENFDEVLKELGVNRVIRTLVKSTKPRVTINQKDGKWLYKSETTFKTTSFEFTPGVGFENIAPNGAHVQMMIRLENGKWIETGINENKKALDVERWVNNQGQLEVKMKCGDVEAHQLFRRVD